MEVACRGGVGRTGTALAALAVLDGLPPDETMRWVRWHYHPRAVETPWQGDAVAGRRRGSADGCVGAADRRTPSCEGTQAAPEPLRYLYNYTGGEWSRLRSCDQGKRAEEGNDELVNHPLQTNKCRS